MNEPEEGTGLIHFLAPTNASIPTPTKSIYLHSLLFPHPDKDTRGCKMNILISSAKTNVPTSRQLLAGRQRGLIYQLRFCCSRCQPLLI